MKICIYGMGAVGGHFGALLAAAGHDVSGVARGDNLAALRQNGVTLESMGKTIQAEVRASDKTTDLGPQNLVISTLKATSLASLARDIGPLLGPDTPVIFAQNGIPWWYDMGLSGDRPAPPDLSVLDPGGALRAAVAAERVIGAVINSPNEMTAPGVIRHTANRQSTLTIGEIDDRETQRIADLRALLSEAGILSDPVDDIRHALWDKLMINMTASILSLLTGHHVSIVRKQPRMTPVYRRLATEALAIAAAHGVHIDYDMESYIARSPDHTPSIRQDFALGRPMEMDSLLLVPLAFGQVAGLDTPCLETIAALAAVQAQDKGLYTPPG